MADYSNMKYNDAIYKKQQINHCNNTAAHI